MGLGMVYVSGLAPLTAQTNDQGILITEMYYGKTTKNILDDFQRKFHFIIDYIPEQLPKGIQPGLRFEKTPLDECLTQLLAGSNLKFKRSGITIIIRPDGVAIDLPEEKFKDLPHQKDFTLKGQIIDKNSGETLPYAQVIIDGTVNGTASNLDGFFTLFHVPIDTVKLVFKYVGYQPRILQLNKELCLSDLQIGLTEATTELEEIQITGQREDLMRISDRTNLVSMAPSKIAQLPAIGEKDIFRSFQLLPGISASQESSGK